MKRVFLSAMMSKNTIISILSFISYLLFVSFSHSATVFYDDFGNGMMQWEVISGQWEVVKHQGNCMMELTIPGNNSAVINIKDRLFDDFTVETRINQVTGDAGAHLYFRNNAIPGNNGEGYWFGFVTSGWQGNPIVLQDTVHFWKMFANIQDVLKIPLELPGDQWIYLKVEAFGKKN